jgi:hypothetical protein
MTRRDLLARALLMPAAAMLTAPLVRARRSVLRLIEAGPLAEDARRGLLFGVREAGVAAGLMGHTVELGPAAGRETDGVVGIVAAGPAGAWPGDVPVILVSGSTTGAAAGCTFRVALTAAEERGAVARWRASAPEHDAAADAASLRAVEWHPGLARYGASELNERFVRAAGQPMTPPAWLAWFAVKVLIEHALRGGDPSCAGLGARRFDGHKGRALAFDPSSRVLRQPLYICDCSVSGGKVVGEI